MSRRSAARLHSAALVLACIALSACKVECKRTSSKERAVERLEEDIGKGLRTQAKLNVKSVACPRDVEVKKGVAFECRAELVDRPMSVIVRAEWTDNLGAVHWKTISADTQKLVTAISQGIASRYGAKVLSVDCPTELRIEPGKKSICTAKVEGGDEPLEVVVTWTDESGTFSWEDRGVVVLAKLAALVEQALAARGKQGTTACVGAVRASKPGSSFSCPVRYADGASGEVVVRVKSWEGQIEYDLR